MLAAMSFFALCMIALILSFTVGAYFAGRG
jgi:hypothetical protein